MKKIFFLMLWLIVIKSRALSQQTDTLYIYFDVNKSELSVNERNKLNPIIEAHLQNTKEIIIAAYADSTGSATKNKILAQNRMQVVKTYLENTNASFKNDIHAKALGETSKYGNDLQKNRCVELVFVPEEKKNVNHLASYAKGDKIVLENILFQDNSHVFLPSSLPALQSLLETLKAKPEIKIMVLGHVCCGANNPNYDLIEPGQNNMKISETRAKAVCDYLQENGIAPERLQFKGLSFKYPLVFPENSEEDRAKNRRVEIEIL